MPTSNFRVLGTLDCPPDGDWLSLVRSPVDRANAVLTFQELAMKALELTASEIQVSQLLQIPGQEMPPGKSHWHRDACVGCGHVSVVLGELTTEFLIGDYDEEYPDRRSLDGSSLDVLAERLPHGWAEPGQVVFYDRLAIHRGPRAEQLEMPRLMMLATPVR